MKKIQKRFLSLATCFILSLTCFAACGQKQTGGNGSDAPGEQEGISDYEPLYFTVDKNGITSETLGDGVVHKSVPIRLTDNRLSVVHVVEADLTKADIRAGTKDNAAMSYSYVKATPYETASAWASETGGTVYASVNADFFGEYCVNAFVKDGYIIKNSHNDNSNYDYTNSVSDVPASAPMLFGVKGDTAQIAPIVSYEGDITSPSVKKTVVKSQLTYDMNVSGSTVKISANVNPTSSNATFIAMYKGTLSKGLALKVDTSCGVTGMTVLEKVEVSEPTTFTPEVNEYGYVYVGANNGSFSALQSLKTGDKISLTVSSEDNAWNGYDTILGCRQALVLDGAVAETVTLENTNGAQRTDIPRTAVGIKNSRTVCLFAVESMRYGGKGNEDDPYGLSLPQLADFICWYGCKQAANFDGGGSTQLILNGGAYASPAVVVRSSDTGSEELTSTRKVMNAFLVTSKVK